MLILDQCAVVELGSAEKEQPSTLPFQPPPFIPPLAASPITPTHPSCAGSSSPGEDAKASGATERAGGAAALGRFDPHEEGTTAPLSEALAGSVALQRCSEFKA